MSFVGSRSEAYVIEPRYLETSAGRVFVTYFVPGQSRNSSLAVLALPPFAEELNKSRRMLALLGQHLARAGILFALPDVIGTGDSEGDFKDARWASWSTSLQYVADNLADGGATSVNLVALRSGVFFIPALAGHGLSGETNIALWSPVQSGSRMIDQILRSKVIRDSSSAESSTVKQIREKIALAGGIEVAGYSLSRELVEDLDQRRILDVELPQQSNILWIDTSPVAVDGVPKGLQDIHEKWRREGNAVNYSRIVGPQFWMGPEIELVPALVEETTRFFRGG